MKKKLLIVDDEPDILEFLRRQLERRNFNVIAASSGQQCLEAAERERPDLILLDIVMPVMDGYEVIKRIIANNKIKHIPIVIHSVRKETKSIFKCLELGTFDYIVKPVRIETILEVIQRYV